MQGRPLLTAVLVATALLFSYLGSGIAVSAMSANGDLKAYLAGSVYILSAIPLPILLGWLLIKAQRCSPMQGIRIAALASIGVSILLAPIGWVMLAM